MKRMACVSSVVAVLIVAAAADDTTPTIKEIMGKLHKGDDSPLAKLKKALKSDEPDWKEVQETDRRFRKLWSQLGQE